MAGITAIAAGVSLATTAATTGASFAQAHKQKKAMQKAEKEAKKAMIRARKELDVNVYKGLSVSMTPYERERDALLSAGAQAMEAGIEGEERGGAATAGRLMAAQREAQASVTDRQTKQLESLEKTIADEEQRLSTAKYNMAVSEAEGAQLAARDAAQQRAASIQQGFEGVSSFMQQGLSAVPLYWRAGARENPDELARYYTHIGNQDAADTIYNNMNPTTTTNTNSTVPPVTPTQTPAALDPYSYASPFYTPPWGPGAPQSGFTPNPVWGL